MRVLLIGLGRWGEKHLRVLGELGVTVWVADVSAERRAWAVSCGVDPTRVVADHRAALDRVDAVDVVTPADTHADVASAALEAGRHCFVEKPLTVTAEDGRRLAALAARAGRVLQVGHIFRFHPVTLALREALVAGHIGAVRFATARVSGFKRPRSDVGVTQTDAIHCFDLLAFVLGRSADRVAAVQRDWLGRGLDDMSVTIVHYGDVVAVVEANYFVPGVHRECVVVGARGSLVADFGAGTLTLHAGEHRPRAHGWEAVEAGKEALATPGGEPLHAELAAFLDACAGRSACRVTAEDGVRALEVVEAAARAALTGESVGVGGPDMAARAPQSVASGPGDPGRCSDHGRPGPDMAARAPQSGASDPGDPGRCSDHGGPGPDKAARTAPRSEAPRGTRGAPR